MNFDAIKNHKSITLKSSVTYPDLLVAKYKRDVFFSGKWDNVTAEARGHVYHRSGKLVINSFTKVFNRGEKGIDGTITEIERDEDVIAVRKVNGFMAAATYVPMYDEVIVSTTGSLDSDFVVMAKEILGQQVIDWIYNRGHGITFLFEVEERIGAYLIGSRFVHNDKYAQYTTNALGEELKDRWATEMKVFRPEWKKIRFGDLIKEMKTCRHEGYLVYSKDKTLKIKSPYYLVTKFLGRLSNAKMTTMAQNPLQFKKDVEEEFYPVVDYIDGNKDHFLSLDEQGRMKFIRDFLEIQATI
jgi:hypothetical protein